MKEIKFHGQNEKIAFKLACTWAILEKQNSKNTSPLCLKRQGKTQHL